MKRNILLAALALFLCVSARADTYFYEPPASGAEFRVPDGGKVVWIDAVSTNAAYTPALKLVREAWGAERIVTPHAATNWTYQVVWTNGVTVITNAPAPAIPAYPPDTMTGIITNETVVTWATTNTVPALLAAETNSVTAGTSYAAPGDKLIVQPAAPSGARVTVGVEN
jgi:hypothetical protein